MLLSMAHQAYSPIVAAGYNSAILHYTQNSQSLSWQKSGVTNPIPGDNNFLLIDAGAEYFGYGSDITRTYPISGRFTEYQKRLYSMVYNVQDTMIHNYVVPGAAWRDLSARVSLLTCVELQKNGLIVADFQCQLGNALTNRLSNVFLFHGFGHLLGNVATFARVFRVLRIYSLCTNVY